MQVLARLLQFQVITLPRFSSVAKRAKANSSETIQDNTVFGKLVQQAGLNLKEGDKQDELGKSMIGEMK